jgi:hypothetical protein
LLPLHSYQSVFYVVKWKKGIYAQTRCGRE